MNDDEIMLAELKRHFPWLGTDEEAGSGADVIQELCDWHAALVDKCTT